MDENTVKGLLALHRSLKAENADLIAERMSLKFTSHHGIVSTVEPVIQNDSAGMPHGTPRIQRPRGLMRSVFIFNLIGSTINQNRECDRNNGDQTGFPKKGSGIRSTINEEHHERQGIPTKIPVNRGNALSEESRGNTDTTHGATLSKSDFIPPLLARNRQEMEYGEECVQVIPKRVSIGYNVAPPSYRPWSPDIDDLRRTVQELEVMTSNLMTRSPEIIDRCSYSLSEQESKINKRIAPAVEHDSICKSNTTDDRSVYNFPLQRQQAHNSLRYREHNVFMSNEILHGKNLELTLETQKKTDDMTISSLGIPTTRIYGSKSNSRAEELISSGLLEHTSECRTSPGHSQFIANTRSRANRLFVKIKEEQMRLTQSCEQAFAVPSNECSHNEEISSVVEKGRCEPYRIFRRGESPGINLTDTITERQENDHCSFRKVRI